MEAGLAIWLDRPVADLVDLAVDAEAAGFADVWMPDHYFLRDVYVAGSAVAARTTRIRLATGVAAVQLRHPALIASSASTVDELSGGRAIIGIGPGGFEFPAQLKLKPRSPLTQLRDAIEIIRGLLRGGSAHVGEYFSATGAALGWDARDIPIYISARGPRMLELAGEVADGVIVHGTSARFLEYARHRLATGAARAGRPADACEIALMFDVDVDDDEQRAIDRLRPRCTIMAGGTYSDDLIPIYGLDPDEVARLRVAVTNSDRDAYRYVTDSMVRAFSVGGSVATVEAELARLKDLGVGRAILGSDPSDTRRLIESTRPAIQGVCG